MGRDLLSVRCSGEGKKKGWDGWSCTHSGWWLVQSVTGLRWRRLGLIVCVTVSKKRGVAVFMQVCIICASTASIQSKHKSMLYLRYLPPSLQRPTEARPWPSALISFRDFARVTTQSMYVTDARHGKEIRKPLFVST